VVLKSLVASQLVYIFSPLPTYYEAIQEINSLFYKFLWSDKVDKIKRNVMINDYPEGGIKMIDIISFNKSLKAVWVKKYLDNENCGHWKLFFDAELKKYGGKVIFRGNLNKTDTSNLIRVSDPFVKELLAIWPEVLFEDRITTKKQFLSSPLWYNSLIWIDGKPVFNRDWFLKGITEIRHLMDNSDKFLSPSSFESRYDVQLRPLNFFGIIAADVFTNKTRIPLRVTTPFSQILAQC